MKTTFKLITLSTILVYLAASAQTQQPAAAGGLAERFKQLDRDGDGKVSREESGSLSFFDAADKNKDGYLTFGEAEAHAQQGDAPARNRTAGMEGDGAGPMTSRVKPVEILETESPIQTLDAKAADGRAVRAFWRKPKGEGPFPAVIFIHGGLTQFPEEVLRWQLTVNPVITRMLAGSYAVVQATFRTYEQDVQSRGPIEDVRAVVHALAKVPAVDAKRIALFGGSGGGSIALELGGDPAVQAIVAGEPATVLYTGMLTTGDYGPRLEMMANPEKYLTTELRERTREKLKGVRAPVLILHGDKHDLAKLNKPLFLPMMREAGVQVEYREYPGYGHGFYLGGGDDRWGKGADLAVVEKVVEDVLTFLEKVMPGSPGPEPVTERFTQLDRNGDGKLSTEEVAGMPSLARLLPVADTDKDTALSRDEIRAASKQWPALAGLLGGAAGEEKQPASSPPRAAGATAQRIPPNTRPIDPKWGPDIEPNETTLKFKFVSDYPPGTKDVNGELLGGTELLRLTAHAGKLFAAVGYFAQDPAQRRAPGAQVVRKDSADGKWVVDATFADYVRVDTLIPATFSVDAAGQKLSKPFTMLVAGLWWKKVEPWGTNEDEPISVAMREDATGRWTISTLATARDGSPGDVRALVMHTDAQTGRQYLFAGAGDGRVYRGAYDPAAPGHLKWEVDPGLPKTARLVTFTECDGALYVAGGLVENNGVNPLRGNVAADEIRRDGGLFRRVDGAESRWELVYRWPFDGPRFNEHLMRGLSVVPDPHHPDKHVIVGGLEDPPLIQRIDPATGQATDELNYMKYFQRVFGERPNKGLWVSGAIMNQLEPFTDPRTGERMHLVTTYIMHPQDPAAPHNGAWFLVRKLDGTYAHGYIYPEGGLPSGQSLHGVRTIIESPFPEERGKVWYFAGHCVERRHFHNTAWIYKGTLKE